MKKLTVYVEPDANKYLLAPLKIGEEVDLLGFDLANKQFIKIRHNEGKSISTFHSSYFKKQKD